MQTQLIGPRRTPNPYIPRDGAWFHQQYGADGQLYSYARGDWRAFVHVDRDGGVSWAVSRVRDIADWFAEGDAEVAQRSALKRLVEVE